MHALRLLLRHPGSSLVIVLTLALGISANTAAFTVLQSLLFRPLPWPDSHRVLNLWESNARKGFTKAPVAAAQFVDLRRECRSFEALAAWLPAAVNLASEGATPERFMGALVTEDYLRVVGTQPVLGTGFAPDHFEPGKDSVVLVSHGTWKERFGADPALIGRSILINGRSRTVVGVLPAGFDSPDGARFWVPKAFRPQELEDRDYKAYRVTGRLAPAATTESARAELDTCFARLRDQSPDVLDGWSITARPALEDVVEEVRPTLWLLAAAVAAVLLMACINVAGLQLARGVSRSGELAVRLALGASRGRLARQLLLESLLLAIPGGWLGWLAADGLLHLLLSQAPPSLPRLNQIGPDSWTLAFTVGATFATVLLFGLLPVWSLSRVDPQDALRGGSTGRFAGRHGDLRRRLVILQMAATFMVLVVVGLLFRSLDRVLREDLGFRPDGLMTVRLELPPIRYGADGRRDQFADDVTARLLGMPGIAAACASSALPLQGWAQYILRLEGQPEIRVSDAPSTGYTGVSPSYFETLGMTLRQGRGVSDRDRHDQPLVCVVNQSFVRRHFPDRDPVGRRIEVGFADPPRWLTVVGVVNDSRNASLEEPAREQVFVPLRQQPAFLAGSPALSLAVRAASPTAPIANEIRRAVHAVDSQQPLHLLRPMSQVIGQATANRRFTLGVLAAFAVAALSLATVGLYGVMSGHVAARTRELGLRGALGATRFQLVALIFGQALRTGLAGAAIGLVGAALLARTLHSMLYQTTPWDAAAYLVAAVLVAGVAFIASTIPAWFASRIEPAEALRHE